MDDFEDFLQGIVRELQIIERDMTAVEIVSKGFIYSFRRDMSSDEIKAIQSIDTVKQMLDGLKHYILLVGQKYSEQNKIEFTNAAKDLPLHDMRDRLMRNEKVIQLGDEVEFFRP